MKRRLKYFVKNNPFLILLYFYLGTFIINILKVFIKPDEKLVLFSSFSGRQFSDSPKAVYLQMIKDKRFKDYKFVWAFTNPEEFDIKPEYKVKLDTFRYYYLALKARIWITNSAIERMLSFKGKKTLYVNTWHGTPIKMLGTDQKSIDAVTKRWYEKSSTDLMLAESKYDKEIFSRIFKLDKSNFLLTGLPRNDELCKVDNHRIESIKRNLNIPLDKKVILYAPTFREYLLDEDFNHIINLPIDFNKWKQNLGEDYIVLLRAHYFINKRLDINHIDKDFVYDMTNHGNINDLMLISDILISDYSSVFFDFSLLERPMFSYAYDYEEYVAKRGLYLDIAQELPNGIVREQDDLLKMIRTLDNFQQSEKTRLFKSKYMCGNGNATSNTVERIYELISKDCF